MRVYVDEAWSGGWDRCERFLLMLQLARDTGHLSPLLFWCWSRSSRDQTDAHFR